MTPPLWQKATKTLMKSLLMKVKESEKDGLNLTLKKTEIIILLSKVHLLKEMDFPVVMYGCESWTIKKAEHQRIDAFELRCCKRLLKVPWTACRSNQWILKEISPEYSLEELMLKLKLQYFGHLGVTFDKWSPCLPLDLPVCSGDAQEPTRGGHGRGLPREPGHRPQFPGAFKRRTILCS